MAQLWGGRFTKETDKLVYNFNASLSFDSKLYKQDITGSMAHASMLAKQGIIEEQEKEKKYESLLDRRQMTEETWVQIAKQYSQTDAEEMQMRLEHDLEAIAAAKQLKKTAEKEKMIREE